MVLCEVEKETELLGKSLVLGFDLGPGKEYRVRGRRGSGGHLHREGEAGLVLGLITWHGTRAVMCLPGAVAWGSHVSHVCTLCVQPLSGPQPSSLNIALGNSAKE